jgi:hypothetical protein
VEKRQRSFPLENDGWLLGMEVSTQVRESDGRFSPNTKFRQCAVTRGAVMSEISDALAPMSTPVPKVFKIFSLHRYFIWSIEMREHFQQMGKQFSPTPSFFDNEDAGRAFSI